MSTKEATIEKYKNEKMFVSKLEHIVAHGILNGRPTYVVALSRDGKTGQEVRFSDFTEHLGANFFRDMENGAELAIVSDGSMSDVLHKQQTIKALIVWIWANSKSTSRHFVNIFTSAIVEPDPDLLYWAARWIVVPHMGAKTPNIPLISRYLRLVNFGTRNGSIYFNIHLRRHIVDILKLYINPLRDFKPDNKISSNQVFITTDTGRKDFDGLLLHEDAEFCKNNCFSYIPYDNIIHLPY